MSPAAAGRTRLDFCAQALDERENAVFEAGSPQVPKSAFAESGPRPPPSGNGGKVVVDEKGKSLFMSPIFWVVAGAAVVGGGTALYLAVRSEPATSAALAPLIRCGAELCK